MIVYKYGNKLVFQRGIIGDNYLITLGSTGTEGEVLFPYMEDRPIVSYLVNNKKVRVRNLFTEEPEYIHITVNDDSILVEDGSITYEVKCKIQLTGALPVEQAIKLRKHLNHLRSNHNF